MALHGDYEHSDARTGPLWIGAVVLAVLMGVSLLVSRWIDRGLSTRLQSSDPGSPVSELRQPASTPELETIPWAELAHQRAEEENALHAPASWIDPLNGVVRIPIEDAMQKVLAEGFPVRTEERAR